MSAQVLLTILLICLALSGNTRAFCGSASEGLHADLTRAVVRSTDWLKRTYKDNNTVLRPYRAGSMFATLRIAGHHPSALRNEFIDGQGFSIEETLENKLKSVTSENVSTIPTPHLGLMIQGVISICKDPENFYGYNLVDPFLAGFPKFKTYSSFSNYFGYSLAVIALCNAGHHIPDTVIEELILGANRIVSYHSIDIDALILTAISCVSTTNSFLQSELDRASTMLVRRLTSKQNETTGAFGNQYSTALVVQALQAARVYPDIYLCDKAMRHILAHQDDKGSFGSILANIQVTPALLGESLISLKNYDCPVVPSTTPAPKIISVHVQLIFNVTNMTRAEPLVSLNVPEGTSAKTILDLAKTQNSCYTAKYKKYSFGHSVQSICDVASSWSKKQYWMIYLNGKSSQYGVDALKSKDGDLITFKYEKLSFK